MKRTFRRALLGRTAKSVNKGAKDLVEEGPTDAKVEQSLIGGVVRHEERAAF